MKKNQHGGKCGRCGGWVAAGQGYVSTERDPETFALKHTCWHDDCPENGDDAPKAEVTRWAVYDVEGHTPRGNVARGVALVDGARPLGNESQVVPLNDAARAVEARRNEENG